jgi:hypothetical protein
LTAPLGGQQLDGKAKARVHGTGSRPGVDTSEPGALQHEQQDQRPDDRQDDACGVHYRTVAGSGAKRSRLEADVAAVIEEVQLQCFKAKTKETSSAADPATVFDRVNRFPSHPQIISDRLSPFANNVLPFALNLRGAAHIRK